LLAAARGKSSNIKRGRRRQDRDKGARVVDRDVTDSTSTDVSTKKKGGEVNRDVAESGSVDASAK
jgi:hypothetical protein